MQRYGDLEIAEEIVANGRNRVRIGPETGIAQVWLRDLWRLFGRPSAEYPRLGRLRHPAMPVALQVAGFSSIGIIKS